MPEEDPSSIDWEKTILSSLKKQIKKNADNTVSVKLLRKAVLESVSLKESDKKGKKSFKKAMKGLEDSEAISIDADGAVSKNKKEKRKKEKEDKKEKKHKKQKLDKKAATKEESKNDEASDAEEADKNNSDEDEEAPDETTKDKDVAAQKGVPCKGNPGGVTRLFLGNLPFAVDESSLSEFLPHEVTHIKWITDKETGKFYGSAFIEMDTPSAATEAVALAGSKLMDRPIKINFAPSRPGDVWPPANKVVRGGSSTPGSKGGGQAGGSGIKAMGEKPENCVKLFIGNLSYDIDDDTITKFFDNVGSEVKAVRWLSHKDTGDFKGCGFVEFWNAENCDKAAALNGKNLLGRPIRIDWTD